MKSLLRVATLAFWLGLASVAAHAQTASVVSACNAASFTAGSAHPLQMTAGGVLCSSTGSGGGDASAANQTSQITQATLTNTDLGALGVTACATDTGSCSLNALMQRLAQRLTTLNSTMGTPFQLGGALAANQSANVTQWAGAAVDTNSGSKSGGTLRVVIATDQPQPSNKFLVTPDAGSTVQIIGGTTGGLSVLSKLVANNTTSFVVKSTPGTLYGMSSFNNSATVAYPKLYNVAQGSVTCGTPTPDDRMMIPANASGAGFIWSVPGGVAYGTAITACVTTGIADNDTGAPAASTYIVDFYYK